MKHRKFNTWKDTLKLKLGELLGVWFGRLVPLPHGVIQVTGLFIANENQMVTDGITVHSDYGIPAEMFAPEAFGTRLEMPKCGPAAHIRVRLRNSSKYSVPLHIAGLARVSADHVCAIPFDKVLLGKDTYQDVTARPTIECRLERLVISLPKYVSKNSVE